MHVPPVLDNKYTAVQSGALGGWRSRLLPLGEDVPVGAAVLHGDTIPAVWCIAADGVEQAVLVVVGDVLQHRRIPHKAKAAVLHLKGTGKGMHLETEALLHLR